MLAPNGKLLGENDTLKRPQYANTLEMIAWNGASWFYDSEFMKVMVKELREYGSILTEEDFKRYAAVKRRVAKFYYGGYKLYSPPAPSSGAVLGLILNILDSKISPKSMIHIQLWKYTQDTVLAPRTLVGCRITR